MYICIITLTQNKIHQISYECTESYTLSVLSSTNTACPLLIILSYCVPLIIKYAIFILHKSRNNYGDERKEVIL
jgi:hypothetical protein